MRLSFVLLAPVVLVVACGQSFSASPSDAGGGPDGSMGVDSGGGDGPGPGSDGGGDATGNDASVDACGSVPSCPQLGWECGAGKDGCGRTVDCGICSKPNETCDLTHHCKCNPVTCTGLGAQCGNVPDGCGNILSCGTCEAGTCGGGGPLKCGSGTCVPLTCASQGAQCGTIEDGCGNVLQCPDTCTPPLTCGGSGNATQCGCTAKTCTDLGWQCGQGDDGCGTVINCGGCDGGACDPAAHSCTCAPQSTCATLGYGCGELTDSCNAIEKCGPVPTFDMFSAACTNLTYPHFYTCCSPGGIGTDTGGTPEGGAADAGTCNGNGPTPPEPGWSCIAASGGGWCCTQ